MVLLNIKKNSQSQFVKYWEFKYCYEKKVKGCQGKQKVEHKRVSSLDFHLSMLIGWELLTCDLIFCPSVALCVLFLTSFQWRVLRRGRWKLGKNTLKYGTHKFKYIWYFLIIERFKGNRWVLGDGASRNPIMGEKVEEEMDFHLNNA